MHFTFHFVFCIWCLTLTWLGTNVSCSPAPAASPSPISDLPVPSLYLDLSPNPYGSRQPYVPPGGSQNLDVITDNTTFIALGLNGEYAFTRETNSVTLVCNATYPITWVFHNTEQIGHASWMISLRMRRDVGIIYDTSTYSYTAELGLFGSYNRLTGNYSCMSTTRTKLRNSVFVYWEGSSPPFLLQSGENRSACIQDGFAVLPCAVSKPNEDVVLWKLTDKGYLHLRQNASITFDPKVGLTLRQRDLADLIGNYMCTPSAEGEPTGQGVTVANPVSPNSQDYVNVKVEQCEDSLFMIDPNKSNATLTYDNTKGQIVCCSNSSRSPKIFHVYCHHPVICAFRQEIDSYFLKQVHSILSRRGAKKGCTKYRIYVHSPGVVRCVGDGIDRTMEYSFPIFGDYRLGRNVSHIPIYFNWNEIQPTEMMLIQSTPVFLPSRHPGPSSPRSSHPYMIDDTKTIYDKQWLRLLCHTSPYYFATGIHWGIRYKNNTLSFVNAPIPPVLDYQQYMGRGYGFYGQAQQPLYIQVHLDMESVICIAPVWNSTEYVHKALHLYVNESVPPTLIDPEHEVLTWVLNDTNKKISCDAKGIPIPEISWTIETDINPPDGAVKFMDLQNTSYTDDIDNVTHIVSETLFIPRVSYSSAGIYNCTVTNFAGTVYKLIEVNVEEPLSWKVLIVSVVGVVLISLLVVGIVSLIWRLRIERRTVQNLAAFSYQDTVVGGRISEINPSYEYGDNDSRVTISTIEQAIITRRAIEDSLEQEQGQSQGQELDDEHEYTSSNANDDVNDLIS